MSAFLSYGARTGRPPDLFWRWGVEQCEPAADDAPEPIALEVVDAATSLATDASEASAPHCGGDEGQGDPCRASAHPYPPSTRKEARERAAIAASVSGPVIDALIGAGPAQRPPPDGWHTAPQPTTDGSVAQQTGSQDPPAPIDSSVAKRHHHDILTGNQNAAAIPPYGPTTATESAIAPPTPGHRTRAGGSRAEAHHSFDLRRRLGEYHPLDLEACTLGGPEARGDRTSSSTGDGRRGSVAPLDKRPLFCS
jgi:hypothetical protein